MYKLLSIKWSILRCPWAKLLAQFDMNQTTNNIGTIWMGDKAGPYPCGITVWYITQGCSRQDEKVGTVSTIPNEATKFEHNYQGHHQINFKTPENLRQNGVVIQFDNYVRAESE